MDFIKKISLCDDDLLIFLRDCDKALKDFVYN